MNAAPGPADIVRSGLCIGCGSCAGRSGAAAASMQFDAHGLLRPAGPSEWLRHGPEDFASTCPFSPAALDEDRLAAELFPQAPQRSAGVGRFEAAYVGHVAEQDFRLRGSSGGMVSWVATELLRKGMIDAVAHVVAAEQPDREGRFFRYRISRSARDVRAGAQSRYYPVEMSEVLEAIAAEPGRYAVVGIPCFIKAVQLLRRKDPLFRERIRYTLGLFCGHMKSARFVESLARQMEVELHEVAGVEFRHKAPERPANWYNARFTLRDGRTVSQDWWHLADGDWGAGFFMAPACNFCDDVVAETADVSFGDAWVEPYSSDWQGTNVVMVRSPAVAQLIDDALAAGRLRLEVVDDGFVAQTQAAGLRQRREGLAYRLARRSSGVPPRKRVAPDARSPAARRKLIYLTRRAISTWSHRMFRLSRATGSTALYLRWARVATLLYHALTYHRGPLGQIVRRLGLR
ncbi:Coenzyme F420 hydrogenase/dehydrogenase, beta subunit C-terminal domain [Lysobacter sp. D1-1-M9]|uniref:Coenzyme F420 hydrogenase/dehydrogenase, beta subunit C-terminal domain n=4 Tax=Novilysobacter TaxID=3382699 RepID=UPI003982FABD